MNSTSEPQSGNRDSAEDSARAAAWRFWYSYFRNEWDPSKHPRLGGPPNAGWFASVAHRYAPDAHSAALSWLGVPPSVLPPTEIDFGDGFHDAVVKVWADAFRKNGIPVVERPSIRVIGPDPRVVGQPDMLIHEPGHGVEAIEVKTGSDPTFTPNQAWYIPVLQIGNHLYSTDPGVRDLGLKPGVPFPPMNVMVIYTPGPNMPYTVIQLKPPIRVR
jgi:hypothetical protein